ncbi:MAG: MlaD family protein [Prevotellaceae bacterium]|jgi:phospholipid/cholesterol/gamma-HCH transport system substrate-binding protein|nr:MlaD family protein [Prevotellaceae bacterium]
MKLRISKELKAGLILLVLAMTMYWLVYFLKGRDIFNHFTSYQIEYQSVDGITQTGPIYIRGLKVGTIKRITYNGQKDLFDVTIQLESRYRIPDNSVAQIYSVDLLGTKAIRINLGNSARILGHNDLISSDIAVDLIDYIGQELPLLKEQITGLLTGLDSSVRHLNVILGSQNQANIQTILEELKGTISHFRTLGAWINSETPNMQSIVHNLNQLSTSLAQSSGDIQSIASNLASFTDSLSHANITQTIHDLDLLLNRLQDPQGTFGKLLYTDEIHQNISSLVLRLDSLVWNINQNPKKFLKFSVF